MQQWIKKYYAVISAGLVALFVVLTALGFLPQKIGIVIIFSILGMTNFIVAVTVWRKGRKLEAGFLGAASILVMIIIVVYAIFN